MKLSTRLGGGSLDALGQAVARRGRNAIRLAANQRRPARPRCSGCRVAKAAQPVPTTTFRASSQASSKALRALPAYLLTSLTRSAAQAMNTGAPDNVRYLWQFGEHKLTMSFTALDPLRTLLGGVSPP